MLHGIQFEQKFDAGLDGANPCFLNDSFIHNGIATWPVKNPPLLFTVVRDPIDRFVSIYGHFCVTNSQCGDKTIHQFAEDVYLSYTGHMSFVTENPIVRLHAFPHTEFCGLYQDHKKYEVIYYSEDREDMRRQFLNIFDKAEVPRAASERALNHLTMSSTLHAMKSASKKRLQILGWNSTGHNSYDYPFYDRMIPHNVCKWISFEIVGTTLPNMTQLAVGLGDRYEMIPYRIPNYRKHGVVTCIAPLYANEQWQYALFAAHLYRRYGSFLQLYVRSMIHPLFEMLKIYEREGYLQIDPWMRVKLKTVHEAFFNPNLHVEFRNQAAAYTDCLLQYKESAEFISFMDLDDVQIPRIGKTYFEEYSHYFFENPMTSYLHYVKEADQAARQIMMDDFTMSQMYTGIVDVLPSMEAGRFVVQPKNINFTWVHFPFSVLEDMKRYDVSSEENFVARLKPLEEYPFTSSQGIPQLFSRKGGMLRKPDFLPAEDANWLQADLKRMFKNPEIRAIWSRMPQDQFYQKLLTSCFHENYFQHYFNSKPEKMTCPGPERCNFPKNPGIECVNAHGEYYSTSGNQRMNIHYATQSHFRVEDGCTP
ncbi:unnamed protein product, partial [Mesorhabditis spiculigera]